MKLKKFTVKAGGQFDGANGPIIIDFSRSNMVGLIGDQETGKTTLEDLILLNIGAIGGEKVLQALRNRKTGELETELEFVGNDKANYTLRQKDGTLSLKREGEKRQNGTQALLREIFGVAGTSPMPIKDAKLDDQIKWLAPYSTRGYDEYMKDITKNKNSQKEVKAARADAGKSAKGLKEYLVGEGIMNDKGEIIEKVWTGLEAKYKKKVDSKSLYAVFEAAQIKYNSLQVEESKLAAAEADKVRIEKQITDLQKQLAEKVKTIDACKKTIASSKEITAAYEAAQKAYENASKEVIAYDKWQDIKKKKVELDEFEDLWQQADSKEKALLKKQQELMWEVIPDIAGVEILLEDTHVGGVQREAGFYYKGLTTRQLSASQWFELVMKILKKNKVQFLIVDDISQFGSKFMETLNGLVKSGCTVLYSEMDRGVDEIQIKYN